MLACCGDDIHIVGIRPTLLRPYSSYNSDYFCYTVCGALIRTALRESATRDSLPSETLSREWHCNLLQCARILLYNVQVSTRRLVAAPVAVRDVCQNRSMMTMWGSANRCGSSAWAYELENALHRP